MLASCQAFLAEKRAPPTAASCCPLLLPPSTAPSCRPLVCHPLCLSPEEGDECLLGQAAAGRCGSLLVSELYADPGCWSGYPPHKHDEERPPQETDFEEVYHYRFRPETGFGAQLTYESGRAMSAAVTRHADTFLIDRGYHPTVASPGHEGYIFTILVGRHQRSLIQYFDPAHRHLMATIPGIQAMRDAFK